MAKYDVECPSCSTTYTVNLVGPQKDRTYKLDNWDWTCDDCIQKDRDEENAKAAFANVEAGLPPLTGTEKQIAWAETIRADKFDTIRKARSGELENMYFDAYYGTVSFTEKAFPVDDPNIDYAISLLSGQTSASWWIDHRDRKVGFMLGKLFIDTPPVSKEGQEIEVEAKAEATIRPEKTITETVTEIRIGDNFIEAIFPEKNEDFRQLVRFKLGYSWTGSCWRRDLNIKSGPMQDRAPELGHKLLTAGFPVRLFDEQIRARAIAGEYEQECKRWIMKRTSGKYEGCFSVSWPYGEDFYTAVKKLPGSRYDKPDVVVPAEQFEQVLDFAGMYEFLLSPGAQDLVETARKIKEQALTAHIEEKKETKQPLPGDKPGELEVPEHVNIDNEFSEPEIQSDTQAAAIASMGFDPVALGGKVVDGQVFKPDADPNSRGACARCGSPGVWICGACARCGSPGVWICGAGEMLCASHQDDY